MNLWQLVCAGLLGMLISHIVKQIMPSYAIYVSLICSLMLTVAALIYAKPAIELAVGLSSSSGIGAYGTLMLRIGAIGVVTSLASDICNDAGETAIGGRIALLGKCAIALTVLPALKLLVGATEKFLM